jgi:2-hydroxycyclohexanecarboxyl-CoA dehydrogenase
MKNQWSTVYISGGGSGIGLHFAKKFAADGAKIAIFDLRISEEVRGELTQLGGTGACEFHELDICDSAAVDEAAKRFRRI